MCVGVSVHAHLLVHVKARRDSSTPLSLVTRSFEMAPLPHSGSPESHQAPAINTSLLQLGLWVFVEIPLKS